jgi:hypothetical protein
MSDDRTPEKHRQQTNQPEKHTNLQVADQRISPKRANSGGGLVKWSIEWKK